MEEVVRKIERLLREKLRPLHVEIRDDSAKHVGHPGASSGGGHFDVVVVAEAFEGRTLLEQHRLVNDALQEMLGAEIHALALRTIRPSSRWR